MSVKIVTRLAICAYLVYELVGLILALPLIGTTVRFMSENSSLHRNIFW